ncbi:MAG: hypothetical protein OCC49_11770 [Fibrobacterales bacterium]
MKKFIGSMAMVTITIGLVATLRSPPNTSAKNTPSKHEVLNSLSSHFKQKKEKKDYTPSTNNLVSTKVRKTTPERMAKKLASSETLDLKDLKNRKNFTVSAKDLKKIAPGTYVTKYKNRYYKIQNVKKR